MATLIFHVLLIRNIRKIFINFGKWAHVRNDFISGGETGFHCSHIHTLATGWVMIMSRSLSATIIFIKVVHVVNMTWTIRRWIYFAKKKTFQSRVLDWHLWLTGVYGNWSMDHLLVDFGPKFMIQILNDWTRQDHFHPTNLFDKSSRNEWAKWILNTRTSMGGDS